MAGSNAFDALRDVHWREDPDVSLREWRVDLPLVRGGRALAFEYADYRGRTRRGTRSAIVSVVDERGGRGDEAVLGEPALMQLLVLLAHSTVAMETMPDLRLELQYRNAEAPPSSAPPKPDERAAAEAVYGPLISRLRELADMDDWHGNNVTGSLREAAGAIEALVSDRAERIDFQQSYYDQCALTETQAHQHEEDLAWKQRAEEAEDTIAEAEDELRSLTDADGNLSELIGWLETDRDKAVAERDAEVAAGQRERDRAITAEADLAAIKAQQFRAFNDCSDPEPELPHPACGATCDVVDNLVRTADSLRETIAEERDAAEVTEADLAERIGELERLQGEDNDRIAEAEDQLARAAAQPVAVPEYVERLVTRHRDFSMGDCWSNALDDLRTDAEPESRNADLADTLEWLVERHRAGDLVFAPQPSAEGGRVPECFEQWAVICADRPDYTMDELYGNSNAADVAKRCLDHVATTLAPAVVPESADTTPRPSHGMFAKSVGAKTGDNEPAGCVTPDGCDDYDGTGSCQGCAPQAAVVAFEDGVIEALAALEHERWSGWEKYRETKHCDAKNLLRWKRQRETAYADLSEQEKESDRVEARKTVAVLKTLGVLISPPPAPQEQSP